MNRYTTPVTCDRSANASLKKATLPSLVLSAVLALAAVAANAAEVVTVDNFVRAETDMTLDRYVKQGAFGKIIHLRVPTPIDQQNVIRMNRDTLYSFGVFDLDAGPVTIVKPDANGRFQSMLVINQDHSMLPVVHESGEFTYTREAIGTRYVFIVFRTFMNPNDPDDVRAANAVMDRIAVRQASSGSFEIPEWDEKSLSTVRNAINVLAATRTDTSPYFGDKSKLNPLYHLLGTAMGWGGNPPEAAMYDTVVPEKNDGVTPYVIHLTEKVPVDGFASITVYNKDGFMEKNEFDAYSFNSVTAEKNADGSVTIHFGGDPSQSNYLPITPGWNYTVRMYQPRQEIINGSWKFPVAQPVQ